VSERQTPDTPRAAISRRDLLRGGAAGAGALAISACTPIGRSTSEADPSTAPSPNPTPAERTVAEGRGTIHGQARSGPLDVPPGATLRFDPDRDTTLEIGGNLVVRGRLEMRPRPGVEHVLRFVGVDESAFVGGGMDPLDTDVGLWVVGDGALDVLGSRKQAWNRSGSSPSWDAADELVAAPVEPGDVEPGPFVEGDPVPEHGSRRAEILNLTRNVRIEGTPGGRAHVFIRSSARQRIGYAALRHLGPRQREGDFTASVLGRYGLHFHHCHGGSSGSLVEGVVVRDCGAHAFVPHMSHGITIRDCIAYEVFDDAYWWDPEDRTDDLLIDRSVAASVHFDPDFRGYRLAGFTLGLGRRIELRRSVAFAIHGARNSAGFVWPEAPSGLWRFEDNLAHNNVAAGIFVWQNVREPHRIDRFTAYHNGAAGIIHGAYANSYHYRRVDLQGQETAIELIAAGRPDLHGRAQSWTEVEGGRLLVTAHGLPADAPALFHRCSFRGGVTIDDGDGDPGALDFVECALEREDFQVLSLNPSTVIRVQRGDGSAYELTSTGSRDLGAFFPY
jgi:hypothetical protein